jgi:tetratricopeptide (TPR) repeat protein
MMVSGLAPVAGAAMTIFARPSEWTRAIKAAASATPFADRTQHYFAFISYSHRDERMADWLQDALEDFRVPAHLVGRVTEHGSVPKRLTPIFRDLSELPASDDLGTEIRAALAASQYLIVLCSPAAAASRWTNAEIEAFKRVRPEGCVLAAILDGEPFASDIAGREHEECMPRALRTKYDRRGRATGKRCEPLAADLRGDSHARRIGFLKLVAGMLGVGLDDLVRRDEVRRHRHLAIVTAASLAGMVVASGLAIAAIEARDAARDQRREAEGLIGFMLGDLRAKLEPVGRLDALDGVGSKVLDYYKKQDMADLSDAALQQRSRALSLMAEIAYARGDSDEALRQYGAALAGTAEALRREPKEAQRLFDHAQNIFWIAELARDRGQLDVASRASREYKSLASRMVALEPDNMRWRVETQYADANLGIVLLAQRNFEEAAQSFRRALVTIQGLANADPNNGEYRLGVAEALAWLADAELATGRLDEAVVLRKRQVSLLNQLLAKSGGDVAFREKLVPAYRALGHALGSRGALDLAIASFKRAVDHAQALVLVERQNQTWISYAAAARLDLAYYLLGKGQIAGALTETRAGCQLAEGLRGRDPTVLHWRMAHRDCLSMQSQIALASGEPKRAMLLAGEALADAKAMKSGEAYADSYGVARAARMLGDVRQRLGDTQGARAAWRAAMAQLPKGIVERPVEMAERTQLLERTGRSAEAQSLRAKLNAIGYRLPT